MKKLALVLGGGGAKGFAHIGVIKVLEHNGIKPNLIVGTSMGAIIGGLYSSGLTIEEIETKVKKLSNKAVSDFSFISLKNGSFFKGKKIENLIKESLGEITHKELKTEFIAVATELATGKQYNLSSGVVWKNILASSAIPAVFPAVEIDGKILYDGCIKDNLPIDVAKSIHPDYKILSVDVVGDYANQVENGKFKILTEIINMSTLYMTQLVQKSSEKADLNIKITQPFVSQVDYDSENIMTAIYNGEEAIKKEIDSLKVLLSDKN